MRDKYSPPSLVTPQISSANEPYIPRPLIPRKNPCSSGMLAGSYPFRTTRHSTTATSAGLSQKASPQ